MDLTTKKGNIPCVACGQILPAQDAHIISRFYLIRHGIPERLCNESWNIIQLCFDCHLIYDLIDWDNSHNRGRRRATETDLKKIGLIKEKLKDSFSEASAHLAELLTHVHRYDLSYGDEIGGEEVTGFDITNISSHMVRIFTYK